MNRRIAAVAAIFLALALVPVALASKGGGSGGRGPAITFDPPTAVVGQQYTVHGTGFTPNAWETVGAYYADTTWWASAIADSHGSFTVTFTATSAGRVLHVEKEQGSNGKLRERASATLTVGAG